MIPPVTVALPVHRDGGRLAGAIRCITSQTHRDLDIVIVLNGADRAAVATAKAAVAADSRVRLIELAEASLPAALNVALREARHDLVARMDADDECPSTRLEIQARFMDAHPAVVALGTAFERVDEDGEHIWVDSPPTEPAEIRWRLCLGNCFCHGSMMLRRDAVLAAGGYDESLLLAQDYDLWLRLALGPMAQEPSPPPGATVTPACPLANLPHILYRYRVSTVKRHETQARAASATMLSRWCVLPQLTADADIQCIAGWIAEATWGGHRARAALAAIETMLTERGPTPQALLARQWVAQRTGPRSVSATELYKLQRVQEAGLRLRQAGVASVWLYGAGLHTAWLMDNLDALAVEVAGVIDDTLAGARRFGFKVTAPRHAPETAHILLSSDAHEQQLWTAAASLRQRGAVVWRLYTADPDESSPPCTAEASSASGISPQGLSSGA